jgi:DtxR family Mn-dependent transcriptional regulator
VPDPLAALAIAWRSSARPAALLARRRPGCSLGPAAHFDRVRREDALKHLCTAELEGLCPTLQSVAGALCVPTMPRRCWLTWNGASVTSQGDRLCLTPAGRDLALHVIRAHRLWSATGREHGYAEAEWHAQAERHEHQLARRGRRVDARLGHPCTIRTETPSPPGRRARGARGQRLTAMALNQPLRVVHVEDEPEAVYAQLIAEGVYPGSRCACSRSRPSGCASGPAATSTCWPRSSRPISRRAGAARSAEAMGAGEPLSALQPGEQGTVTAISPRCRGPERWRLMDLGILPGTVVTAELLSPGGDPVAYRVRDTLIALRREQADFVRVRVTPGPGATA